MFKPYQDCCHEIVDFDDFGIGIDIESVINEFLALKNPSMRIFISVQALCKNFTLVLGSPIFLVLGSPLT